MKQALHAGHAEDKRKLNIRRNCPSKRPDSLSKQSPGPATKPTGLLFAVEVEKQSGLHVSND